MRGGAAAVAGSQSEEKWTPSAGESDAVPPQRQKVFVPAAITVVCGY